MSEQRVEHNKVVSVSYTISDEQGEILEVSDVPISYIHGGDSDLFEQIEAALVGCKVGEEVEVRIPPEEGFGEYDPNLTFTDDIENVPPEYRRVGAEVEMQSDRGDSRLFHVTRMEDGRLTVDGNHPFAGKTLIFTVKVEHIRDARPEELTSGVKGQMPLH